jgi:hypothetical protein
MIAQTASDRWSELLTSTLGTNVSNRAQNHQPCSGIVSAMVKSMKPVFAFLSKLLAMSRPQSQQFQSQRMCPFCGLITPRAKRFCLECGKSLNPAPPKVKEAKQEG